MSKKSWKYFKNVNKYLNVKNNFNLLFLVFHPGSPRGHACYQILSTSLTIWPENTGQYFPALLSIGQYSWQVRRQVWDPISISQLSLSKIVKKRYITEFWKKSKILHEEARSCRPDWDRNIHSLECSQRFLLTHLDADRDGHWRPFLARIWSASASSYPVEERFLALNSEYSLFLGRRLCLFRWKIFYFESEISGK